LIIGIGGRGDEGAAEARSGPSVLRVSARRPHPEYHLLRHINIFVTVAPADLHKELGVRPMPAT